MKNLNLLHDVKITGVEKKQRVEVEQMLIPEIERIKSAVGTGYETPYASINLPSDVRLIKDIKRIIAEKKEKHKPTMLIVIGIGGSNFGTIAIHQALNGLFYNEQSPDIKLYFVDSVDSDYVQTVYQFAQQELDAGRNVLVNVVSKSGTTTETVVNFELFYELLRKKRPDNYQELIVATTDEGSKLWRLAIEEGFTSFHVPKKVGGRYSVFSAVGLFPLAFIGIDIDKLLSGAGAMVDLCTQHKNPAATSAATIFAQYQKGRTIHDSFFFSKQLAGVGGWYRQLVGEGLGKEKNLAGEVVNVGITPTVSIGTNDLHSVTQLYLAGPHDKFTTFITVQKGVDVRVPTLPQFEGFVANVQGMAFDDLRSAIVGGMYRAYEQKKRPFMGIEFQELSAEALGAFLQMKMLEVMFLGFLFDINPFNQPQVELYKAGTKEILLARRS